MAARQGGRGNKRPRAAPEDRGDDDGGASSGELAELLSKFEVLTSELAEVKRLLLELGVVVRTMNARYAAGGAAARGGQQAVLPPECPEAEKVLGAETTVKSRLVNVMRAVCLCTC